MESYLKLFCVSLLKVVIFGNFSGKTCGFRFLVCNFNDDSINIIVLINWPQQEIENMYLKNCVEEFEAQQYAFYNFITIPNFVKQNNA